MCLSLCIDVCINSSYRLASAGVESMQFNYIVCHSL